MIGALCVSAQSEGGFLSLQRRIIEIYKENKSAIVRVHATFQGEEEGRIQKVLGTGFFISREGHVITNASATDGADRVWVEHEGVSYAAEFRGSDLSTNLALLQLDEVPEKFNFLHLTDSPEVPPIGSMVVRLSALYEFEPSPNLAIVSGVESGFGSTLFRVPHLRVNISAGPGEGGAPMLDLSGNLVGVTVATLPPELLSSYCIPTRAVLRVRDDLLFSGKVGYGWLGFEVGLLTTTEKGAQVVLNKIIPKAPAEEAGLLVDDVLLQIGDYPIKQISDVGNAVFYTRPGQFVAVKVLRGNNIVDYTIKVAPRPSNEPFVSPIVKSTQVSSMAANTAGAPQAPENKEANMAPNDEGAADGSEVSPEQSASELKAVEERMNAAINFAESMPERVGMQKQEKLQTRVVPATNTGKDEMSSNGSTSESVENYENARPESAEPN